MHHVKTSFFLSGLFLTIEISVTYFCLSGKAYPVGAFFLGITLLDVYRIYRKVRFLRSHPSQEERMRRLDQIQKGSSYYYNIWYRFADASEHEYIANKFHERLRKLTK